jgi:RNA polymerase sigma-70 factor (ECF subfamily)
VVSDELSANEQSIVETDLVNRAKTDRAAFSKLYDRFYPLVARYCMRRLFDRSVAEDVVGDVFLNVATNLPTFRGATETDFRCWLFRIATNAVNACLRQTKRRRELLEAAARSRHLRGTESSTSSSTEWEALDWPVVYRALLALDERDQTIVMLRFFAGSSHEEIAGVVNATPGSVRTALSRTLTRLREEFNPSGDKQLASGKSPGAKG